MPSFFKMKKGFIVIFIFIKALSHAQFFSGCGSGLNANLYGLFSDTITNKLIVSGNFTKAGNINCKGLATWDGQKFDSLGTGYETPMYGRQTPFIHFQGKLYTQGIDLKLQYYNYSTKIWTKLNDAFDGVISSMVIFNHELFLSGDFRKIGLLKASCVAKYNGFKFDTLNERLTYNYVSNLCVYKNRLYAGGNFGSETNFGGIAYYENNQWHPLSTGLVGGGPPEVSALTIYKDKLYIGGMWFNIDGKFNPSCVAWDGNKFISVGILQYIGGQPATISKLIVHNGKLFAFGGVDRIINPNPPYDTLNTNFGAVWDDYQWCPLRPHFTSFSTAIETYKDKWYFNGYETMYGDSLPPNANTVEDSINYLGVYIANNGQLEKNCSRPKSNVKTLTSIYPNPFTNSITLENIFNSNEANIQLEIINSIGQKVYVTTIKKSSKLQIDLYFLPTGIYYLKVIEATEQSTYKIIKSE